METARKTGSVEHVKMEKSVAREHDLSARKARSHQWPTADWHAYVSNILKRAEAITRATVIKDTPLALAASTL